MNHIIDTDTRQTRCILKIITMLVGVEGSREGKIVKSTQNTWTLTSSQYPNVVVQLRAFQSPLRPLATSGVLDRVARQLSQLALLWILFPIQQASAA